MHTLANSTRLIRCVKTLIIEMDLNLSLPSECQSDLKLAEAFGADLMSCWLMWWAGVSKVTLGWRSELNVVAKVSWQTQWAWMQHGWQIQPGWKSQIFLQFIAWTKTANEHILFCFHKSQGCCWSRRNLFVSTTHSANPNMVLDCVLDLLFFLKA